MITTQSDDYHNYKEKVMIYPAKIHVIRCRQTLKTVSVADLISSVRRCIYQKDLKIVKKMKFTFLSLTA